MSISQKAHHQSLYELLRHTSIIDPSSGWVGLD